MTYPVNDEVVVLVKPMQGKVKEVRIPRVDWDAFDHEVSRGQPHTTNVLALLGTNNLWVRVNNDGMRPNRRKVA